MWVGAKGINFRVLCCVVVVCSFVLNDGRVKSPVMRMEIEIGGEGA